MSIVLSDIDQGLHRLYDNGLGERQSAISGVESHDKNKLE